MHTPGEWNVEEKPNLQFDEFGNYLSGYVVSQEYINVAEICGGIAPLEAQANARLIAQAPVMLEALEDIARWDEISGVENEWPVIMEKVRAVLAQAKGI